MSTTKIILAFTASLVVGAEVYFLLKIAGGPPPMTAKNINPSATHKQDPKDIDWIAVQNKVLGYKTQKVTPWVQTEIEAPVTHVDIDPEAISQHKSQETKDSSADNGKKPAKTALENCGDGQDCKWNALWDDKPAKAAEPAP